MTKPDLSEPCPGLTGPQKWEQLKKHAPEAWDFYERVTTGDLNGWWQDKPLQLLIRAILYIGQVKAERAQALRDAEKAGMERAEHWRTLALNVVAAWEVLGMGYRNNRVIERWLGDDMAPAINAIRAAKETKE